MNQCSDIYGKSSYRLAGRNALSRFAMFQLFIMLAVLSLALILRAKTGQHGFDCDGYWAAYQPGAVFHFQYPGSPVLSQPQCACQFVRTKGASKPPHPAQRASGIV